ncbi:MAG: hypothetical protein ACXVGH_07575 [Mycobacteriales bacterium]
MRSLTSVRRARLLVPAVAAALVLTGCNGSASTSSSSTSGSSSSSASASPYLPVPDGVSLTPQGSQLKVGDDAVVAYQLPQQKVGVLDITVDRLEKTTFKKSFQGWQLDAATRKTNPYFVRATVKNVGTQDLGGQDVPLYIVDGQNVLIPPTSFKSSFKPCPSTPFPKAFGTGDQAKVCLVYLAPDHGDLTAVSFRPSQAFNPITWTGELVAPKATPSKKKKPRTGKSGKNGG